MISMKRSLKKLRGLALNNHNHKHASIKPLAQLHELDRATQDMQDMRDCYDTLLSAAAATASSAYGTRTPLLYHLFSIYHHHLLFSTEFSNSLRDMGSCLVHNTALNDHTNETGKLLLMLGKIQFKLHKLIDHYRSHLFQTITIPSESLLNELRIVQEMKQQCDEKRDIYEYMVARYREGGRSKGGKGETFSLQQLQTAHDEYDEEATLFIFRLKSLKQGQLRSLLTQAARHHAAQLGFFKKAVNSLETIEPHVKSITEQQHIDYHFNGLEEEDGDEGDYGNDDDDDGGGYDENDDGELSFDYGQNEQDQDVSTSRNSMELDQVELTLPRGSTAESAKKNLDKLQRNLFSFRVRAGSQSAPLFADNKPDSSEKLRQMRPSLSRKFSSYVLPIPVDAKSSTSPGPNNPKPSKMQTNLSEPTKNLWHSSPLEQKKHEKDIGDEFPGSIVRSAQSVVKESNNNAASTRLPPPLVDKILSSNHDYISAYSEKIKRNAFSGPLTSNPSGSLTHMSSPKISELHELPRPPTSFPSNSRLLGSVGHSGPLIASNAASPLPMPPQAMARSFSIPSSGTRVAALHGSRTLESSHRSSTTENIASPPSMSISLSCSQPSSDG